MTLMSSLPSLVSQFITYLVLLLMIRSQVCDVCLHACVCMCMHVLRVMCVNICMYNVCVYVCTYVYVLWMHSVHSVCLCVVYIRVVCVHMYTRALYDYDTIAII